VNALSQFITNQIHCSQFPHIINIATFPIHDYILTKMTFLVIFFPHFKQTQTNKKEFQFQNPLLFDFWKIPQLTLTIPFLPYFFQRIKFEGF